jgi:hypothetical protein
MLRRFMKNAVVCAYRLQGNHLTGEGGLACAGLETAGGDRRRRERRRDRAGEPAARPSPIVGEQERVDVWLSPTPEQEPKVQQLRLVVVPAE